MTTSTGAVTSLLGQQGQASQPTGSAQVDPEFVNRIIRALPDIVRVVGGVVSGQSMSPQSVIPQSGPVDQVDPEFFNRIVKILPDLINVVGKVVGQSAGPQSMSPLSGLDSQVTRSSSYRYFLRSSVPPPPSALASSAGSR